MTKPIQIKREDVTSGIREIASLTGQSMTDVVAEAILEKLDRVRRGSTVGERRRKVDEIVARFAALPNVGPMPTDDDFYDEDGFPK